MSDNGIGQPLSFEQAHNLVLFIFFGSEAKSTLTVLHEKHTIDRLPAPAGLLIVDGSDFALQQLSVYCADPALPVIL